jgi:hypothetical protein
MGAGFVNGRSLVDGGASKVKNESWDAATGKNERSALARETLVR